MSRSFKLALLAGGLVLAAAASAAVALSTGGDSGRAGRAAPATSRAAPEAPPQALVVRRHGGVPPSWRRRLRRTAGVTAVTQTARTQLLLRRSRRADGRAVDAVRAGYAIPLDVLVVQPGPLAGIVPEAARELRLLRRGTALLSRTSARLRRLRVGDRLGLVGGRELRVAGIVDDELFGFTELILGRRAGGGSDATRQLVVATTRPERVEGQFARDGSVRIRPLARSGPSGPRLIARPLEIKARFGEFAVALPYGPDWVRIDPRWLERNIVTRRVPILGPVTCNRRLFAPLRRALGALARRGLSRVVDPGDYAGCFAPRRIPGSGSLSLHAWGLAIDVNAAANPRLGDSRQDRRLVRAMEDAGFTWGGRWPTVPDPMHFELHP